MDSENNVKKHENDNRTAHGHEKKKKKNTNAVTFAYNRTR